MSKEFTTAQNFLDTAYEVLDFDNGDLLNAENDPSNLSLEQWLEKGEWLSIANRIGAERIFFVENNPVVVFTKSQSTNQEELKKIYNSSWCMARPAFLFIASPGELAVYSLSNSPARENDKSDEIHPIYVVQNILEVQTKLKTFSRESIESGKIFEDEERFGSRELRADNTLIRDLKIVRERLEDYGLKNEKLKYAHGLIGRSIFVRYLEDRQILIKKYFDEVANGNEDWQKILQTPADSFGITHEVSDSLYLKVLSNKDFTYALFERLTKDFNGDMFPSDKEEKEHIDQRHLNLLADFLSGRGPDQGKLFFWAYKFDIVPIELISSIYEEFYHVENKKRDEVESSEQQVKKKSKGKNDENATHYTRAVIVDFLLSQVLKADVLKNNPRILDPTCGSGIFLVEAFRRIVRFRVAERKGKRLSGSELRNILRDQIVGIEINPEAAKIAAFSLYLALLHYQDPPDILQQIEQGQRLPNLLFHRNNEDAEFHFNIIFNTDAFKLESNASEINTAPLLPFGEDIHPFPSLGNIDIIVGNPPWGSPKVSDLALEWCNLKGCSIGRKECSQAFILKALDLVRAGGYVALLVPTGVLLKTHERSEEFRREWLKSSKLLEVVNFSHVRKLFFSIGIAPFVSVFFQKKPVKNLVESNFYDSPIVYWSLKESAQANNLQAIVLQKSDRRLVSQEEVMRDNRLWKILWWGNHRDKELIQWLEVNSALGSLVGDDNYGRGIQVCQMPEKQKEVEWLAKYKLLKTNGLTKYGKLKSEQFSTESTPTKVEYPGLEFLYSGNRFLLKRGITQAAQNTEKLIVRFETEPFCFKDSIHAFKLKEADEDDYKVLLGILWSSVTKYYLFLTSNLWGSWHDSVIKAEIFQIPVRLPDDRETKIKICRLVDTLRNWDPPISTMYSKGFPQKEANRLLKGIEDELDETIFDLYKLTASERDQIRDMCGIGLDFYYNGYKSYAVDPILNGHHNQTKQEMLFKEEETFSENQLLDYTRTFIQDWKDDLKKDEDFAWKSYYSKNKSLIAVIFTFISKYNSAIIGNEKLEDWEQVLTKLDSELLSNYNSDRVFIDGMVRGITKNEIIIIKRNEKRLWTHSAAYEDAEATRVMIMQHSK